MKNERVAAVIAGLLCESCVMSHRITSLAVLVSILSVAPAFCGGAPRIRGILHPSNRMSTYPHAKGLRIIPQGPAVVALSVAGGQAALTLSPVGLGELGPLPLPTLPIPGNATLGIGGAVPIATENPDGLISKGDSNPLINRLNMLAHEQLGGTQAFDNSALNGSGQVDPVRAQSDAYSDAYEDFYRTGAARTSGEFRIFRTVTVLKEAREGRTIAVSNGLGRTTIGGRPSLTRYDVKVVDSKGRTVYAESYRTGGGQLGRRGVFHNQFYANRRHLIGGRDLGYNNGRGALEIFRVENGWAKRVLKIEKRDSYKDINIIGFSPDFERFAWGEGSKRFVFHSATEEITSYDLSIEGELKLFGVWAKDAGSAGDRSISQAEPRRFTATYLTATRSGALVSTGSKIAWAAFSGAALLLAGVRGAFLATIVLGGIEVVRAALMLAKGPNIPFPASRDRFLAWGLGASAAAVAMFALGQFSPAVATGPAAAFAMVLLLRWLYSKS